MKPPYDQDPALTSLRADFRLNMEEILLKAYAAGRRAEMMWATLDITEQENDFHARKFKEWMEENQ